MYNQKTFIPIVVIMMLLFSSCRARFYTPNRHVVPLFREKGNLYADFSSNLINKYDVTAGYAISNNIGAYAGYGYSGQSIGSDSGGFNKYTYVGNGLNLGLGYFINKEQSQSSRFEIYGDYYAGNFKNKVNGNDKEYFNGNFQRYAIVPTFGYYSADNRFAIAYTLRAAMLKLSNADYSSTQFWSNDIRRFNLQSEYYMLEHAMTTRFGGEGFKFQLQLGMYRTLQPDYSDYAISPLNFSLILGVVVELNTRS